MNLIPSDRLAFLFVLSLVAFLSPLHAARADGSPCNAAGKAQPQTEAGFVTHRCPRFASGLQFINGTLFGIADEATAKKSVLAEATTTCRGAQVTEPRIRLMPFDEYGARNWDYTASFTCTQ